MEGINRPAERGMVCLMSVDKHGKSLTLWGGCVSAGMTAYEEMLVTLERN